MSCGLLAHERLLGEPLLSLGCTVSLVPGVNEYTMKQPRDATLAMQFESFWSRPILQLNNNYIHVRGMSRLKVAVAEGCEAKIMVSQTSFKKKNGYLTLTQKEYS